MVMNILEFVTQKGLNPKRMASTKGGEYHCPCPNCGGDDRFHVWPEQNNGDGSYWCRMCGKSGDAIQFLIDFEGMSFKEACAKLGKDLDQYTRSHPGTPKPNIPKHKPWHPESLEHPPDVWKEKAGKLVKWANEQLQKNDPIVQWLEGRGISANTANQFMLGWNPGDKGKDLFRHRESWGLESIKKDDGKLKKLWLPIGLVIPLLDGDDVLRIRIRRPEGREPVNLRYYILPGSYMAPLVINPDRKCFTVVETELDGFMLHQAAGDIAGFVALGSSGTKPDTNANAVLEKAAVILNALDFDAAGAKAKTWWQENYKTNRRWPVPKGTDPGEAYQQGVDIRKWIQAGLPPKWTLGQSDLDNDKQSRKAAPEEKPAPVESKKPVEIPEAVYELEKLLKMHPVQILNAAKSIKLLEDESWVKDHWDESRQISMMVYKPGVFEYIRSHPEKIITGKNLIQGEY